MKPSYNRVELPDNPVGWYQLGLSVDIKPGEIAKRVLAGHDIVLYRTEGGELRAIDPYCPHLGAHFGDGGRVCGDEIVCPFHGFKFDTDGECTGTGYGTKAPPKSKVAHWPIQEADGFVFVFYHPQDEAPHFSVPTWDQEDWTTIRSINWQLNGHPQETTENSVDIGHFGEVHKYTNIKEIKPMTSDGPYLTATYGMSRKAVVGNGMMDVVFEIHAYGFGYSFVEATMVSMGIRTRHYVLSTPLGNGKIDLRIACAVHKITEPSKIHPILGVLPGWLVTALIDRPTFRGYKHDVMQDYDIWNNKIHLVPPILAQGDGPIGKYRRWAKQFYVDANLTEIPKDAVA